jgi:hypothetical protein
VPEMSRLQIDLGNVIVDVKNSGITGYDLYHNDGFEQARTGTAISQQGVMLVNTGQWDNSARFKQELVFSPQSATSMSAGNPKWLYIWDDSASRIEYHPQTFTRVPYYNELICVGTSKGMLKLSAEAASSGGTKVNAWAGSWMSRGIIPGMTIEDSDLVNSGSPLSLDMNKILYAEESRYQGGVQANEFSLTGFQSWGGLDDLFCDELYYFRAVEVGADYAGNTDDYTRFLIPKNVGPTRGT